MNKTELIDKAEQAMQQAYCPYSKYAVGAAVLAADGSIYTGCNMENSSYGLSICAERSAFCSAVTDGCQSFKAIAIIAGGDDMPTPCGACLQVMSEFSDAGLIILTATAKNKESLTETTLGELLVSPFSLRDKTS